MLPEPDAPAEHGHQPRPGQDPDDEPAPSPPSSPRSRTGVPNRAGPVCVQVPSGLALIGLMPSDETIQRISLLMPSDLAEDVLAAVESLGGEGQRVDIIKRALEIGSWSEDERDVVSWYAGAARTYHLRTLADYAVTVCKDRGELVEGATRGRWRLARAAGVRAHPFGRSSLQAWGSATIPSKTTGRPRTNRMSGSPEGRWS